MPTKNVGEQVSIIAGQKVGFYGSTELQTKKFDKLANIDGISCKNKIWDNEASEQNAIAHLKLKTYELGGNGITNLSCTSEGTNLSKNCWSSITCTATAIKIFGDETEKKPIDAKYNDIPAAINLHVAAKPTNKKWLLVIAPENYDKTTKVIYSATSGKDFATAIAKLQGVPEQNSYLLIGDSATTGAVKDAIAKLGDNVKEGDTIYFYYSGHGIPDPASKESFILPKDKAVEYVAKEQELKLSNIYATLQNSKASKIIAVVDACFSGMTDGQSVYKGVAAAHFKPKSFNANPNGKLVILTAGKDNQFSNSYNEKSHRLFSYFVIKSLLDGRKNIDDIYKDIAIKVKDESRRKGGDTYEQEPQMIGNSKLKL